MCFGLSISQSILENVCEIWFHFTILSCCTKLWNIDSKLYVYVITKWMNSNSYLNWVFCISYYETNSFSYIIKCALSSFMLEHHSLLLVCVYFSRENVPLVLDLLLCSSFRVCLVERMEKWEDKKYF